MVKLAEVESRLRSLDISSGQDLIFDLLATYGLPQTSITKLRTGSYNRSGDENTVLWKKKVWDTYAADATEEQLLSLLDRAQANADIRALKPRFFVARSDTCITAVDNRTGQTLDAPLTDLPRHAAFFMPWAGAEQVRSETASYVDIKVAQQMAKLYDEIIATNPDLPTSDESRRCLNLFFSRLLFCFFAEDTGVFPDGLFTQVVTNLTASDGSDTASVLDQLFTVLDTPDDERVDLPSHFEGFGYVNGSLFSDRIEAPGFSRKARNIVVDCGTLDWSSINPDIFGSMIQAVAAGEDRTVLGMHYTSVENILKVLNPLFLDDLEERYEAAEDSVRKLNDLLKHLGEIKVFDPACGSGNFLIVAYKRLRALEHRILQRLVDLEGGEAPLFADSRISLENFYGIEIDDFAHDIAKLSLWFAKHQMNQEYDDLFGIERPLIPLTETGAIVCDNAARVEWTRICVPDGTTFVCGNPPYAGSSLVSASQRADFDHYFAGEQYPKQLDYVSLWFLKGCDFMQGSGARVGFVLTNSVCQGQHVAMLWPPILARGIAIAFAHTSFQWANAAVGNAGVACVVLGLTHGPVKAARLYDTAGVRTVDHINPYLVDSPDDTIVEKRRTALGDVPPMSNGSKPTDGGNLVLSERDRQLLVSAEPAAAEFVRPFIGSSELISAKPRYCLWISADAADRASGLNPVGQRIERVRSSRLASSKASTRKYASVPYKFEQVRYTEEPCVAVPEVSSERRPYIPVGLFGAGTVLSNKVFAVYGARPWLFALLQSKMHMAWVSTVCGRLENRYSYSTTLGYNTFPFPSTLESDRLLLSQRGLEVLAARERWPDRSLADLYDPDKMPANLRTAHEANDALVDSLYRKNPFESDADRMELLLAMYRQLVAEADSKSKKG